MNISLRLILLLKEAQMMEKGQLYMKRLKPAYNTGTGHYPLRCGRGVGAVA
jgi:hypothetical protein